MFVWTFGLSPPDASACCSEAAFAAYSAASCRSEVMLWTKRYPEDPAPRGLAGQELGTLEKQKKPKINTVVISFISKARSCYSPRYSKALWSWRSRCNGLTFAPVAYPKPRRIEKKNPPEIKLEFLQNSDTPCHIHFLQSWQSSVSKY